MSDKKSIFSERLKNLLNEKKNSQSQFSEMTGISQGAISQYLMGTYEPKTEKLKIIAEKLNVTPYYLLGVNDYKNLNPINDLLTLLISRTKDNTLEWYEETNDPYDALKSLYPNYESIYNSSYADYLLIIYKNLESQKSTLIIDNSDYFTGDLVDELYNIIKIKVDGKSYIFDLINKLEQKED